MENSIGEEEKEGILECIRTEDYTQGKIVESFEKKFAEWNGSEYALMVSSGSCANILIVDYMKHKYHLNNESEILVPNVTWPTTIYPVIQAGLSPVFCDVDESYCMSPKSLERMIGEKTKGVFVVHLLGQSAKMKEIQDLCDKNGLFLIEDCCESTGAKYNGKKVGNFGEMGSFSTYFGHHMNTIEGGLITTNDFETYDLIKSMRSHGMTRDTARENNYPELENNKFVFDVVGYNFRSSNINAAIGISQLNKIDSFIDTRLKIHKYFLEQIKGLPIIPQEVNFDETSSFSLGIIFENEKARKAALRDLPGYGVECRPIVAGNLLRQPVFKGHNYKKDLETKANEIHDKGIYLPNNQYMNEEKVDYMVDCIRRVIEKSE